MADTHRIFLTGLWQRTSQRGQEYLTGQLGQGTVLVFRNGHKDRDDDPDFVVYLASKVRREQEARIAHAAEQNGGA